MTELGGREKLSSPEFMHEGISLLEIETRLGELYGQRDTYWSGRESRVQYLYRAIDDLQNAIRREAGLPAYEGLCARIVSRILCIARAVDNTSVVRGLEMKYPLEGCAYCGRLPCQCLEKRDPVNLSGGSVEQNHWSLRDWQTHLTRMYGDNNARKGINYTLLRLGSEYGELISLEHSIGSMSIPEVKQEYALELADALAWTIATASLLGVDLQSAVEFRYGTGCGSCLNIPCSCPPHSFSQARV